MMSIAKQQEAAAAVARREERTRSWMRVGVVAMGLLTLAYVVTRWIDTGWLQTSGDFILFGVQVACIVGVVGWYAIGRRPFAQIARDTVIAVLLLVGFPAVPALVGWLLASLG